MTKPDLKVVEMMKVCTKCSCAKAYLEFYKHNRTDGGGYTSRCKICIREDNRKARKKHTLDPALAKKRYRRWREKVVSDPERHERYKEMKNKWNRSDKYYDNYFKKKFGISLAEFNAMHARQFGLCANISCGREISLHRNETNFKAVVDHCHGTGRVRSLMCVRCNSLLGHVENNGSIISGLMDYLNKNSS